MKAPSKQIEILELVNSNRFSFLGIIENKLSLNSMGRFMIKINIQLKYSHNIFNGKKRRIFILWDTSHWSNIILHSNEQYITCILHNVNGASILCSTVYTFNEEEKRINLWNYLVEQSTCFNLPWIMAGDFNTILSSKDRMNNNVYNSMSDQNFIDCIALSKLVQPHFTGNYFTWRAGLNF